MKTFILLLLLGGLFCVQSVQQTKSVSFHVREDKELMLIIYKKIRVKPFTVILYIE